MSTDYPAGTVAKIKPYIGDADEIGMLARTGAWVTAHGEFVKVADARPLVVLDLAESTGKAMLADWLRNNVAKVEEGSVSPSSIGKDMRWLADQIEAQMKPPRIPEPGLWAVVKADTKGQSGNGEHINIGAGWLGTSDGKVRTWATLIDPTLIREGVES